APRTPHGSWASVRRPSARWPRKAEPCSGTLEAQMLELREVFEMVTKQTEPDLDSWKKQEDRQRCAARNRRLAVLSLVAAFAFVIGVFAWTTRPGTGKTSVTQPPSNPVPFLT